ncbi:nucleotidyl transferase AbiEii/AbiGii toxin family protein [Spirosoma aerolatum]|uniref:nucleotidyl transferase AbiEii/AbiGii toxin family protein n=1 Tax=Spirosoma aerolatum TaxID=1211326 RepID=UPI0009AF1293|nr:nucleotidyl transferase AbiEii/AbiGii toxin family protein [Spirosoma aerolatum]
MINLQSIQAFFPQHVQQARRFMLREYLQCRILEILFNSDFRNQFAFLGGTCLRLVHDNQRFSEDLDFDNFNISTEEFDQVSTVIAEGLELQGYTVEFKTVNKGAYHCYIRFPNMLFEHGLSGYKEEKILIQLDTEPQNFVFKPETVLLNRFDTIARIFVTPIDVILAQKFYAILNRPRNKGRDFFDVVFLLGRQIKPNYAYLNQKIGIDTANALKERLIAHCATLDMDDMAKDVEPFLFYKADRNKVILFLDIIKQASL